MDWTDEELQAIVDEHALVLFMKGTPNEPQCGFSNRAAQVLQQLGEPFAAVNILTDPRCFILQSYNLRIWLFVGTRPDELFVIHRDSSR